LKESWFSKYITVQFPGQDRPVYIYFNNLDKLEYDLKPNFLQDKKSSKIQGPIYRVHGFPRQVVKKEIENDSNN